MAEVPSPLPEPSSTPTKAPPPPIQFPPTPPGTAKPSREGSVDDEPDTQTPCSDTEPTASVSGSSGVGSVDDGLNTPVSCSVTDLATDTPKPYPLPPKYSVKKVLPEDLKTPDKHVERDPRLIRLTGLHPFNVEAPLSDLFNEGFLTSEDLHYVRNHGGVPECEDDGILDWTFSIEGMVDNPITMSVRDLIKDYEQTTYPVTLVCAGNRRKEQNVVRKSKGFSWGPAGLSTALWTGVPIGELLARARPKRGAKYVCMEGADKLPNGYYGTSVKLNWCMDPNKGIMVAHKMNGDPLRPDHGKPVRIVIPGQIGGRSVKWLKKLIVTAEPSDNWYHIYDNRVLPTTVSPEASADLPDTWKDERYAIYDLNVNSAICSPAHDEKVSLVDGPKSYKVQGYAYGGGGRRITRVEVTLDKGKSWRLANIRYPEDDYRLAPDGEMLYGGRVDMWWRETSFCWCFWELDFSMEELQEVPDIMMRAMDESMMVQPREMYWSVLGMMNNPWFRIVIHKDAHSLRFEHPTQPALMPGGWMERVKKAGGNLMNGAWGEKVAGEEDTAVEMEAEPEVCMTNPKVDRTITIDELRQHDGEIEPWFVVNGEVYDPKGYVDEHPGGPVSIFGAAGQDATEEFMTIHSSNAKAMLPDYHIGTLDKESLTILTEGGGTEESDPTRAVFLQPKSWVKAILEKKTSVSSDTKVFTFKLDHENQEIGLPIGQHLLVRLRDPATREAIIRAYTPLSEGTDKAKLDVLVKIYYDTAERKGGKMTQALDAIPLGHFVDFKGPVGKFEYHGRGQCSVTGKPRTVRRFVMICAGSGITPIFQVLRAVMKEADDTTECVVLDGNRVEQDILCRIDLDAMAAANAHRCKLLYTLSKPEEAWTGGRGRLDKALLEKEVGPCKGDSGEEMALICGPEALEKSIQDILRGMGWRDEDMLVF